MNAAKSCMNLCWPRLPLRTELLLSLGGPPVWEREINELGMRPIHSAFRSGDLEMASALLRVAGKEQLLHLDYHKQTPLHHAAKHGHVALVELAMQYDEAPLLRQDSKDKLPIHWAAQFGHQPAIKALLATGNKTQLQVRDLKGKVALHRASSFGHKGAVQELLDGGSSQEVLIEDDNAALPLHNACFHRQEDVIEPLLQFHASDQVMAKNWDGCIPLHLCVTADMNNAVSKLLSVGPVDQILESDHYGWSPLVVACLQANDAQLELMLETYSTPEDVACIQSHCRSRADIFQTFNGRNKVKSLLLLARYNIISAKDLYQFADLQEVESIRAVMHRAQKKSATSDHPHPKEHP